MRIIICTVLLLVMTAAFGFDISIASPGKIRESDSLQESVQDAKKVQLFMTSWCPYCRKMEQFLIDSKIPYSKLDVDIDQAASEDFRKLGGDGVPLIVVDRTLISGYDPQAVSAAWDDWNKK